MRIQAELFFSQNEVICVPVDPKLSGYRDRLSLEDPALTFRMRLFGARVRMTEPSACVALVLPGDCVLHAADASAHEAGLPDFDGIPEDELHIVTAGPTERPDRLAVERSAFDEVIAFAKAYGLTPVCVVIPNPCGGDSISVPVTEAEAPQDTQITARLPPPVAASNLAMPAALERELLKRKKHEDAKNSRAVKAWSWGGFLRGPEGAPPSPGEGPGSPAVIDPPIPAPLLLSPEPVSTLKQIASVVPPEMMPDQTASADAVRAGMENPLDTGPAAAQAHEQAASLQAHAARKMPRHALAIGLAASVGLVAFGGMFLLGNTTTGSGDASLLVDGGSSNPAPLTQAAATTTPVSDVGELAQAEVSAPVAAHNNQIALAPDESLAARAPVFVTASASAPQSTSAVSAQAIGVAAPLPPSVETWAPKALRSPELTAPAAVTEGPNGVLNTDDGPTRFAVAFPPEPSVSQVLPPVIGDAASGGIRMLAATARRDLIQDLARPDQVTTSAGPLTVAARAPQSARPSPAPTPRPIARRVEQPSLVTRAPAISPLETARLLGPEKAPRPLVRPSPRAIIAQTVAAEAPYDALPTPPDVADVAVAQATSIAQGSVPGLRVLAIVGSGTGRQALVQTGPNQTTVLVAGSATARWRVLEVRRDGVVLDINGGQRLLPIGL